MTARYLVALRQLLKLRHEERRGRVRCCVCSLPFVTHPCNGRRGDLRCPFGCRQAHRRRESTRRSAAYYRTAEGRDKKAALNARRRGNGVAAVAAPKETAPELPGPIITYVCEIVRRLDGRRPTRAETIGLVARVLRQRRLDFRHGSGDPPPPGS